MYSRGVTSSSETVNPENPFVPWLLEQIESRGWTVQELSRRADVAAPTLWNVINRKRSAGPALLSSLAAALGVSEIYVFNLAGLFVQPVASLSGRSVEILSIFDGLSEEDQETLLWMARSLLRKEMARGGGQNEGGGRSNAPASQKAKASRARKPAARP